MRFRSLAIAVAAAAAGASLDYYVSGDGSRVTTTTEERTVTVMETVVRGIARPDRRAGRRVFVTVCSSCHSLEPGNWTGDRVNLADLQPSYRVIVEKVTSGGIVMPSFARKLTERQIRDVAAFVAAEAARRAGRTR